MSQAVMDFVKATGTDPDLRCAVEGASGAEGVIALAAERGFDITVAELRPVLDVIAFFRDVAGDEALQAELAAVGDAEALVRAAGERGYDVSAAGLSEVATAMAGAAGELTDAALDDVAGGTLYTTKTITWTRTAVEGTTDQRTATVTLSGSSLASPLVPGGSVLSAAISQASSGGG